MQTYMGLDARAFDQARVYANVTVRPLVASDRAAWDRLWNGYLDFYETTLPKSQYDLTFGRYLDPTEPMFAFVAEHEGKPHGLVHTILHRHGWMEAATCYLQDLYVDPDLRGIGMGRALIEHVYHVTKAAGGARVYWMTHETNAIGRQLYDRIADRTGFIQYGKKL